jgi:hypothetical protein
MELREIGKTVARIETRMSEQHLVTVERLSSASRRMDGMDARMDRHERHTKQEISSLDRKLDSRLSQSERTLQRLIAAVLLMVSLALQPILGNWADTIKPLLSIFSSGK